MKLTALMQPGALRDRQEVATATPATLATHRDSTVADVATVAVAGPPVTNGDTARRLWLVTLPSGEQLSVSCSPPASATEVQARWPGATVEPEPPNDPGTAGNLDPLDEATIRGWLASIEEHDNHHCEPQRSSTGRPCRARRNERTSSRCCDVSGYRSCRHGSRERLLLGDAHRHRRRTFG